MLVAKSCRGEGKRLYQVARKAFLFFSAQVEVYRTSLVVQQNSVPLEQRHLVDLPHLKLQDNGTGTLLTYAVQATPNIPYRRFHSTSYAFGIARKYAENATSPVCELSYRCQDL